MLILYMYFNTMLQSDWLMRGSIYHLILPLIQNMASNAQNELGRPRKTSQYRDFLQELEPAAASELASFPGVGRQPVHRFGIVALNGLLI